MLHCVYTGRECRSATKSETTLAEKARVIFYFIF